jgi:hypothetical protein
LHEEKKQAFCVHSESRVQDGGFRSAHRSGHRGHGRPEAEVGGASAVDAAKTRSRGRLAIWTD